MYEYHSGVEENARYVGTKTVYVRTIPTYIQRQTNRGTQHSTSIHTNTEHKNKGTCFCLKKITIFIMITMEIKFFSLSFTFMAT